VFSALMLAGMGAPIPEELPIVTAGVLVGHAAEPPPLDPQVAQVVAAFSATPGTGFPAVNPVALNIPKDYFPPPKHNARLRWWIMLPLCIVSVVMSDSILYGMGRIWGQRLLGSAWMKRLMSTEKQERMKCNFHK